MANDPAKVKTTDSSWSTFTQSSGGSTKDIRKSSAIIRSQVADEVKIFTAASLMDGGIYISNHGKKP